MAVRSLHFAAKGGQQELNNPFCVAENPIAINTMGFNPNDGHNLVTVKSWIDESVNKRGWGVISFHALYDPNIETSSGLTLPWTKQGHWSALQYLHRYPENFAGKKIWVAPVKKVARYILDQYARYDGPYCP